MWARNLLFLGLVIGGFVTLTAALFPSQKPRRVAHFDPQELQRPEFRAIVDQVDNSFRQQWSDASLKPAPHASDFQVARRLSLAMTGTVPSIEEMRQFESQPKEMRVDWRVAELLQDPRFGDYWAERLARTYVGVEDGPFIVYRRRRFVSWLSDELMKNDPYDRIVRDLIAGQGLWTDNPATNFLTVTIEQGTDKKGPSPERLAGRTARAFLGIRLDCAQCHNHPFEKWKKTDFQGLAAFYGQVKMGFTGAYDGGGEYQVENRKTGKMETIEPQVPVLPELLPQQGSRRERLASWVTDPHNVYFARVTVNRVWALMFGRPLVEPVDSIPTTGDLPPALTLLTDDFVAHHYDVQRLVRVIAATEVFHLDSASDEEITNAHDKTWAAFPMTRLRPEQVAGSILQASSVTTVDREAPILSRAAFSTNEKDFVRRYGDTGEDAFNSTAETIPQRLLLMNGTMVKDKTKKDFFNADTRIGWLARDDHVAVDMAYLAVLSRHPTPEEAAHFEARLAGSKGDERSDRMEDLYWTLLNCSEFSWNH